MLTPLTMILGFLIFAKLTLYGLAVFRMAVLISDDTGPFRFLLKFRSWLKREEKKHPVLKKSDVASGVQCRRCTSLWMAIPIAAYATLRYRLENWAVITIDTLILALALSALAIIFSRAFPPR